MIIYLFKVVLCSALFLGCYYAIFQREKIYQFNRFYLLFSLILPFIIPFIEIENGSTPIYIPQVENEIVINQKETEISGINEGFPVNEQTPENNIGLIMYVMISAVLLLIFIKNIFVLIKEVRNNEKVVFDKIHIVLLKQKITPYSFINYIFVNRDEYKKKGIEKEILLHECTHIKQYHSIDILVIELMKVFLWWNPLLYLYKKAVQLNHEFLADQSVINAYQNVTDYQNLLLEKVSLSNRFLFTSSFNYSITKQRLIMMTKSTSKTKAMLITLAFVPLYVSAFFVFSTKIYAQKSVAKIKEKGVVSTSIKEGASDEMMSKYKELVIYYMKKNSMNGIKTTESINKNEKDKDLLVSIFITMSKKQQDSQTIGFRQRGKPLPRIVVSERDFESYKNSQKYGLWINDKKVKNSELDKYKASDFGQVFISRLEGGAKYEHGVSRGYDFQLDLMTNDHYEKYRNEVIEDKSYMTYYKVEGFRKSAKNY